MNILSLIGRQNGTLVALMRDGRSLYGQTVDPTDIRGERLMWVPVDTSSLPKHLGIATVLERQDQRLCVLLSDGTAWHQVRDKESMSEVRYVFQPIDMTGLPAEPKAPPKPKSKPHVALKRHYN